MSSGWLIFLIAVGVVAFFVVGMSLTIIFKGHYMESEIGENRHMKARGIRCASQQLARGGGRVARRFLGRTTGRAPGGSCSSCTVASWRRTRSGAVPGRASPCPGPVRQPFRSVGCFSVLSSAVSGGRRQGSPPVASVLAPVFVFYEVCRPGRRVWNAARAVTTHEKLRRHPR